ncbi:hypothetical protein B0H12DRAFT_1152574 [Mycena haematopus]|nr:hypothetical protein B0H12DRAFT_1152574 [Mycena haematopus]
MSKVHEPQAGSVDDRTLLASLGYKQELKREFTAVELFGFGFSVSAIVPSVASVLVYSLPNGGQSAMIWGWATASVFLMFIAMAMAELSSAAPTSGTRPLLWTYKYSSPRTRNYSVGSYITGLAGSDWSCAVLIMAGATIGRMGRSSRRCIRLGVFCAVVVSHALVAINPAQVGLSEVQSQL